MKIFTLKNLLLSLLILFVFNACGDKKNDPAVRTIDDVEASFRAFNIKEGTHDLQLEFLNSVFWNFRMIAPKVGAGEKKPLFLVLHGASGGDPNAHKSTACLIEPGLEGLDAFILSPNGGTIRWDDPRNEDMIQVLTLLSTRNLPIDMSKIVVIGYSNGGNGSWYYGETQPTVFSAAIPMASSYSTETPTGGVRVMQTPMYVVHGEKDELFPLAQTKQWVEKTVNAGSKNIKFVVAPGLGHYTPCDYVSYVKDAVKWLQTDVWK